MPTPKNGFQILNLHSKKHVFKKIPFFLFNVLLPKFYQIFTQYAIFGTLGSLGLKYILHYCEDFVHILSYVTKNDEKKNPGTNGLMSIEDL